MQERESPPEVFQFPHWVHELQYLHDQVFAAFPRRNEGIACLKQPDGLKHTDIFMREGCLIKTRYLHLIAALKKTPAWDLLPDHIEAGWNWEKYYELEQFELARLEADPNFALEIAKYPRLRRGPSTRDPYFNKNTEKLEMYKVKNDKLIPNSGLPTNDADWVVWGERLLTETISPLSEINPYYHSYVEHKKLYELWLSDQNQK
jgi:hypothetical protein